MLIVSFALLSSNNILYRFFLKPVNLWWYIAKDFKTDQNELTSG